MRFVPKPAITPVVAPRSRCRGAGNRPARVRNHARHESGSGGCRAANCPTIMRHGTCKTTRSNSARCVRSARWIKKKRVGQPRTLAHPTHTTDPFLGPAQLFSEAESPQPGSGGSQSFQTSSSRLRPAGTTSFEPATGLLIQGQGLCHSGAGRVGGFSLKIASPIFTGGYGID